MVQPEEKGVIDVKNDQQHKALKERSNQQKINLAAQSFIETLNFAVPILRFFKWLASAAASFVH
ncbi:hypothetical protein AXI58_07415 [Bacillus nakamurai]|uniref:Uncharacterized protein n=1 Tax=Bacillus nakamurai TaxID=1793963 RepID=A0A150FBL0_9BACI|nr:hypothetical protein AXI58_07415 [Bacillus nakamurai]